MLSTRLVRSVALAALLAPSIGFAQSAAPTPPTGAPASSSPAPSAATQGAVDQRIRTLQSQLGITEAQMPLWSAFAQAMRENAAATDALFTQRAGAVAAMNALMVQGASSSAGKSVITTALARALRRRGIDVVPFGLPSEPAAPTGAGGVRAAFPAIGPDDEVILWNGGLWPWFDAATAIRAVGRVAERKGFGSRAGFACRQSEATTREAPEKGEARRLGSD